MGPQQSGRKRPRGNGSGRYRSVSRDLEEAATPPTPVLPPLEEEMEVEEDVWAPLVRVGRRGHSVFYIKAGAAWSFRVTPLPRRQIWQIVSVARRGVVKI